MSGDPARYFTVRFIGTYFMAEALVAKALRGIRLPTTPVTYAEYTIPTAEGKQAKL